jgi:hypothetical protein
MGKSAETLPGGQFLSWATKGEERAAAAGGNDKVEETASSE